MVWDGSHGSEWGRNAANMIYRPGVRVEIPLMFREAPGSDYYQPMSRNAMRRVAEELRRLANEIDRACAYGLNGGNAPLYPLGSALYQIKGQAESVNRGIQTILKAEKAAAEQELGQWEKDNPNQELTASKPRTVDTVGTDRTQHPVLKAVR